METTLVIMAAGMGSRFGGLKQATPITEDGLGILDFSVYDAKKAGFSDVVIILRKEIQDEFKKKIGFRLEKRMKTTYVLQDTDHMPEGRTKPFGTGHAILAIRGVVHNPFCIINADDYYGPHAFKEIQEHLSHAEPGKYAMVAYELGKTLSPNGTVTRGVCTLDKNGMLKDIEEVHAIDSKGFCNYRGKDQILSGKTPVSMNLWGLTPEFIDILDDGFKDFEKSANLLKDEYLLPDVVGKCMEKKTATVKAYQNEDQWFGMTYKEDLPSMKAFIKNVLEEGYYPGI